MPDVKIYKQVNRENSKLNFGISKMEDIYDKRQGLTDDAHRHEYFTLIFVQQAKGKHLIDFQEFQLEGKQIYFISPGQVHQIIEEEKSYGYALVFSNEFLAENNIPLSFIQNLKLFNAFGDNPPLLLNELEQELLLKYFEEIWALKQSDIDFKLQAIGSLLKLILIRCNNVCTLPKIEAEHLDSKSLLLKRFKELVEEHFAQWHTIQEYAKNLNISADHLNRVVKSLTGKTAKEHLQDRLLLAAKRLLFFSEQSAKEIGYTLGFSEPANFSAFFKKNARQSPTEFRTKH